MTPAGTLFLSSLIILSLNIPFGYWRANVPKLSWHWFLAIHLPVPVVVLLRYLMHTGRHSTSFVLFISAFVLGQLLGGYIYKRMILKHPDHNSSCLVMDLIRNC